MVRDEVLRLADQRAQFADTAIAECELAQQRPPLRIGDQLQEPDRRLLVLLEDHAYLYQTELMDNHPEPLAGRPEGDAAPSRLARRLGVFDAVVIGLGAMIGAGVFAAIGPTAAAPVAGC